MTRLKTTTQFAASSRLFIIAGAAALTLSTQSAHGASPVRDQENVNNTGEIAATTQQTLTEAERLRQLAEEQLNAMGRAGSGMSIINSPAYAGLGSQSDFYANMEKFGFDMCAINLCQVGDNPTDTTDIDEARDWANRTFFASIGIDNFEMDDLREVRRRALAYTAANSLALSTTVHNDLAAGGGSAQAMEQLVDSATSRREDLQANSAIALAQYKILVQQLAVLTALLDVQSAQAIQDTNYYHEEGGVEFPDAYIEGDYRVDGTHGNTLTIPEKGSPN